MAVVSGAAMNEISYFFGTVREAARDLATTIMSCGCCTQASSSDTVLGPRERRWLSQAGGGGELEDAEGELLLRSLEMQALREIRGTDAPPTVRPPSPAAVEGLTDEELAQRLQADEDASFAREELVSLERARRALALRGRVEHRSDGAYVLPVSYDEPEEASAPPGAAAAARRAEPNVEQRAALLRRLPHRSFHAPPWQHLEEDDDEGRSCQICLDRYHDGEQLTALPCLHSFHSHCVAAWLQSAPEATCPSCNCPVRL